MTPYSLGDLAGDARQLAHDHARLALEISTRQWPRRSALRNPVRRRNDGCCTRQREQAVAMVNTRCRWQSSWPGTKKSTRSLPTPMASTERAIMPAVSFRPRRSPALETPVSTLSPHAITMTAAGFFPRSTTSSQPARPEPTSTTFERFTSLVSHCIVEHLDQLVTTERIRLPVVKFGHFTG